VESQARYGVPQLAALLHAFSFSLEQDAGPFPPSAVLALRSTTVCEREPPSPACDETVDQHSPRPVCSKHQLRPEESRLGDPSPWARRHQQPRAGRPAQGIAPGCETARAGGRRWRRWDRKALPPCSRVPAVRFDVLLYFTRPAPHRDLPKSTHIA
jgi:hypothetical protein